ncbi:MAG TPA: ABATE domain-containing protein [Frankiaceae bacterium]|nr:ABATE domain-containing protein [Frankiaceae bacterium]
MPPVRRSSRTGPEERLPPGAGRVSLDLLATLGRRRGERPLERLPSTRRLGEWLLAAGLVDDSVAPTPADLERARALREALQRLAAAVVAGAAPDPADAAVVDATARAQVPAPRLLLTGSPPFLTARPTTGSVDAALAAVARDGIDLLTGPSAAQLRICAADPCARVYLDPSGRRRYCSSQRCGSRSRVAAHRERRRLTGQEDR